MKSKERPIYSMAVARHKTGLTDRQIRYYEECGLINPVRTAGNQRLFTAEEIQRLLEIKELIEDGLNVTGVKEYFAQLEKESLALKDSHIEPRKKLPGTKKGLTSLYPVSNRAQLVEMLIQRKKDKVKKTDDKGSEENE